jgi:predicted ribonuclease YlaK
MIRVIYVLLDTNILIYDPYVVKKLVRRSYYVVIPVMVIDELDKLKMKKDLKQNITKTGQVIEEIINEKNKYLNLTTDLEEVPGLPLNKPDNYILAAAYHLKKQQKNVIFITNDRFLRLKSEALGIKMISGYDQLEKAVKELQVKKPILSSPTENIRIEKKKEEKPGTYDVKPASDGKSVEKFYNKGFLTLKQKREIFKSFPELSEQVGKYGKISYKYYGSKRVRKEVARELSHTGNGYVYGAYLPEYKNELDPRGWICIKDYGEKDLRELIRKAIEAYS